MSIGEAFGKSAGYYDEWVKKAVPCFDDFFRVPLDVMPFARNRRIRVLDLGAGTGLFSSFVSERYPNASFVLVDLSEEMLSVAKERFSGRGDRFEYMVRDYRDLSGMDGFDLVVSSLSIHHLEDADKRRLYKSVQKALEPGGIFLNCDQIKGETEYLRKLYWENWLKEIKANGASPKQIREGIRRRKLYDRDALLADQLKWLKAAGFPEVDCIYRYYFLVVLYALNGR